MIALIDSGIGCLPILEHLAEKLPHTSFIGFCDQHYFPYGNLPESQLLNRAQKIILFITTTYPKTTTIVLACNTITTHAIDTIRKQHPTISFIGVEPPIKPACIHPGTQKIGVLATPNTIASERYLYLKKTHAKNKHIIDMPCHFLASAIEKNDQTKIQEQLQCIAKIIQKNQIDALVLGCTHYVFLHTQLSKKLPHIKLFEPTQAVSMQAEKTHTSHLKNTKNKHPRNIHIYSTKLNHSLHRSLSEHFGRNIVFMHHASF